MRLRFRGSSRWRFLLFLLPLARAFPPIALGRLFIRESGRDWGVVVESLQSLSNKTTPDEEFQVGQKIQIVRRDKAHGIPARFSSSGAADAVDVIFGIHWKIEIHHMRHAVDVNPARNDVGGDKHLDLAILEVLQRLRPLLLRAAGMQLRHTDTR